MVVEPEYRSGSTDSCVSPPEPVLGKVGPNQLLPLAHADAHYEFVDCLREEVKLYVGFLS